MSKKWILHIAVFLCCFPISVGFSQENSQFDKKWENIHERIDYRKPNRPAEPNAVYTYPPSLNEQDNSPNKTNTSSNKPADDEIIYSRKKRYNNSDDSGVEKHIKKNEDDDFDDLTTPDSEAPDIDSPDWDGPDWDWGDGTFFKYLLIIALIIGAVLLIYHFFFKNNTKKDQNITSPTYGNEVDINPQTKQKSQLETDLESAINKEDYRLATRVYYTIVLQQLIQNNWINWKKKKTNSHYLMEMNQREVFDDFQQCVRIYEWVWYGKNNPTKENFTLFSKHFNSTLNRIQS